MDEGQDYSDGAITDYNKSKQCRSFGTRWTPSTYIKEIEKMSAKCYEVVKQKGGQTRY